MKRSAVPASFARRLSACAAAGWLATACAPAVAADAGLALVQGKVYSDAVGSVVDVALTNGGAQPVGSAVVTCRFTGRGGQALGAANTSLFNILPGQTGTDQVHLMGAAADKAECTVTSTGGPIN